MSGEGGAAEGRRRRKKRSGSVGGVGLVMWDRGKYRAVRVFLQRSFGRIQGPISEFSAVRSLGYSGVRHGGTAHKEGFEVCEGHR